MVDWYMTSDNYSVPAGSEGKADADDDDEAAAAAAAMIAQLLNVIRRMIKQDKSVVAVKSTVTGSKRILDMLLKKKSQPEAIDNANDQELKVGTAVAAALTTVALSREVAEADQVSTLKKQIEEKKASLLLAKAKEATREPEGGDAAIAKAADDADDDPPIGQK